MPNIYNPGSFLYPSGNETVSVVGSGAVITLSTSDINLPRTIMASGSYSVLQLPDVSSSSAYTSGGTHFTGMLSEASYPVFVKNSGGQGLEPVLEKVLPAGIKFNFQLLSQLASGVYSNYAYSASGGNWAFSAQYLNTDYTNLKMLSRLNYNAADITGSFGTLGNNGNARNLCMLSSTLAVTTFVDTSGNVKVIPFQISADGLTQVSGAITQVKANGGATLMNSFIGKVTGGNNPAGGISPSGIALVGWWDSTNSLNGFAAITVTSGVSIPTVTVGGSGDDTTAVPASGNRIWSPGSWAGFTPDGPVNQGDLTYGPNQWLCGCGKLTGNAIAYYIVVSGTTPTVSGVLAYGGIETTGSNGVTGIACASLTRGTAYAPSNKGNYLMSLTASGGTITSGVAGAIGIWPQGGVAGSNDRCVLRVDIMDAQQGNLFCWINWYQSNTSGLQTKGIMAKVGNGRLMTIGGHFSFGNDSYGYNQVAQSLSIESLRTAIGDGEFLNFDAALSAGSSVYYDIKGRARNLPALTSNSQGNIAAGFTDDFVAGISAPINYFSSPSSPVNVNSLRMGDPIGIDSDKQTRRVGLLYTYSTNITASGLTAPYSIAFFDFPKR